MGAGKDAIHGFLRGFAVVNLAKWLKNRFSGAFDAVKKWARGHSPWGLTEDMGKDAARGFAQGLLKDGGLAERNAKKLAGNATAALNADMRYPETPRSGSPRNRQPRFGGNRSAPPSVTLQHKGITRGEMREIMHEMPDRMVKAMQAIAAMTSASPEFMRFLDAVMSKDFDYRNKMGANPV